MNCAIKLKGYEVAGSTFQDRKFIFTDRDISGDVFTAVVYNSFSKKNEIDGLKVGNEVFFPYSTLENLKTGRYRIEFWATMAGIGKEMIALEEFFISTDPSCTNGSNETNVSITFKEEVINFTIQTALMYGGAIKWENVEDKPEEFPPSAHVHQWGEIEDKPTVFYEDTEIKEEIAKKVDKVAGKSLSTNDFTHAEKVKLASLENFDDTAIQTKFDTKVDKVAGFGLSKNNFSDADKNKLDNLENYNDEDLLAEIEKRVLKQDGYGLSQNNFTTGEKNKLAGLDGNKFFGKFANETALSALVGIIGAYAYVGGVGRNDESYIWDDDDNKWVKSNNISTAETPASVKTKYESNPDTNAFTNARRDKLNNAVVASDLPTANVGSATKLQNARTFTLGNTSKTFDGSANVAWTLAEIGAQAALTNPITGTATSGQVAIFNGTTTQTGDNGLFWNNTNKRLGIGTTTPRTSLDVNGDTCSNRFYATEGITLSRISFDGFNGVTGIEFNSTTGLFKFFASTRNFLSAGHSLDTIIAPVRNTVENIGDVVIQGGGSERARFKANGNVGIGTTSPAEKLDVNGRIKSKAIVLEENTETLPKQITYENRKFYGTDSTGGKRMFQFADYQAWLDTVNGMTDAQKTEWKTAMNGGWTTNTMSVGAISPPVADKQDRNYWIVLKGANLSLNPSSFSVQIMNSTGTVVIATVPNSQVQLYTNGTDLVFYYNFKDLALGNYKIRLWNGVASYTTSITLSIVNTLTPIDFSGLTWTKKSYTAGQENVITVANASMNYVPSSANKAYARESTIVASCKSSQFIAADENFYIEGTMGLTDSGSSMFANTLGLVDSTTALTLTDSSLVYFKISTQNQSNDTKCVTANDLVSIVNIDVNNLTGVIFSLSRVGDLYTFTIRYGTTVYIVTKVTSSPALSFASYIANTAFNSGYATTSFVINTGYKF